MMLQVCEASGNSRLIATSEDHLSRAFKLSRHADAHLADMSTTSEVLKRGNNLIPSRPKLPLHGDRQPPGHDEPRGLLQVLPRAHHDAPDHAAFREGERRDVGHLFLGAGREEPDDGDAAAVGYSINALGDGARAAVLEDEVGAAVVCDALDLGGPVRGGLVVYGVVGAVGVLDVLEFGVGGGGDYCGCAGCFGED